MQAMCVEGTRNEPRSKFTMKPQKFYSLQIHSFKAEHVKSRALINLHLLAHSRSFYCKDWWVKSHVVSHHLPGIILPIPHSECI